MIHLHFVGDGERDAVTVPELVQKILGCEISEQSQPWARLHGSGRGYQKKLVFAMLSARAAGADGLVATIDRDKDQRGERFERLRQGRQHARIRNNDIPTALGEAIPHGEAWLLDEPAAVKSILGLGDYQEFPNVVRVSSPKNELEKLLDISTKSGQRPRDVWKDIAAAIKIERYQHPRETGFAAFADDVRTELGPLVSEQVTSL